MYAVKRDIVSYLCVFDHSLTHTYTVHNHVHPYILSWNCFCVVIFYRTIKNEVALFVWKKRTKEAKECAGGINCVLYACLKGHFWRVPHTRAGTTFHHFLRTFRVNYNSFFYVWHDSNNFFVALFFYSGILEEYCVDDFSK